MTARAPLFPLQLDDLVGLGAARRDDLDLRAFLLADEGRRASGEVMEILPFLASASGSPTICHTAFFSVSSSIKVDGGAKGDGVAGKLRHVDGLGTRQLVFEFVDAALVERLRFLRGMIFGILRKIAVRARVGNLLDDARTLHLLAVLVLGFECRIAAAVIGILSIGRKPPKQGSRDKIQAAGRKNAIRPRDLKPWLYTYRRCGLPDS